MYQKNKFVLVLGSKSDSRFPNLKVDRIFAALIMMPILRFLGIFKLFKKTFI